MALGMASRLGSMTAALGLILAACTDVGDAEALPKAELADATTDEREVLHLLDEFRAGLESRDLMRTMRIYSEAEALVSFTAAASTFTRTDLRQKLRRSYEAADDLALIFTSAPQVTVGGDQAFVSATYRFTRVYRGTTTVWPDGRYTAVAQRRPAGWRIVQEHSSLLYRPGS
jgi:ketosteroid isomerase-like protein